MPAITVLRVYRLPIAEEELLDDLRRYFFFGNATRDVSSGIYRFIDNCVPLALFDVVVSGLDDRFRVGDFTQEMAGVPDRKMWQVAYGEAELTPDGTHLFNIKNQHPEALHDARLAFYFHYYDPSRPMLWTYGQFSSPPVQMVPEKLVAMIPYTPVD